jgi:PiT family inorganic phosphate transporter
MTVLLALFVGLFLAFANGANDNFKGVATLLGSGTTNYSRALAWATVCTLLGSLTALVLAKGLLVAFSGKGLVPDAVVGLKSYSISVVLASGLTVMLATRLGFPVSTTHSLIGGLVGAGWVASASGVSLSKLGGSFFLPLFVSPVLAILGTFVAYFVFSRSRRKLKIESNDCLCVTEPMASTLTPIGPDQALAMNQPQLAFRSLPSLQFGTTGDCYDKYAGSVMGVEVEKVLTLFHFASAGAVSFARGLNDTPKIVAMLLVGGAVSPALTIILVAVAIAGGGLTSARRVAGTMAHRVSNMNAGQGFTANFVTALIVIIASKFGMPVSTTHVSCGAIFGIGAVTHQARRKAISSIVAAWITTLPIAAALGALIFPVTNHLMR